MVLRYPCWLSSWSVPRLVGLPGPKLPESRQLLRGLLIGHPADRQTHHPTSGAAAWSAHGTWPWLGCSAAAGASLCLSPSRIAQHRARACFFRALQLGVPLPVVPPPPSCPRSARSATLAPVPCRHTDWPWCRHCGLARQARPRRAAPLYHRCPCFLVGHRSATVPLSLLGAARQLEALRASANSLRQRPIKACAGAATPASRADAVRTRRSRNGFLQPAIALGDHHGRVGPRPSTQQGENRRIGSRRRSLPSALPRRLLVALPPCSRVGRSRHGSPRGPGCCSAAAFAVALKPLAKEGFLILARTGPRP